MSRWYRAYEGTVTDAKLHEAAMIAGVSRSVAIATWHAILEACAAAKSPRFDTTPRRIAVILGELPSAIEGLFAAMSELDMIADGEATAWARRQFDSDNSTERSRRHRETLRNGDATLQGRPATPPDTDTDSDTEKRVRERASAPPAPELISEDWQENRETALAIGIPAERIASVSQKFRANAKAKRLKSADWDASWLKWCIDEAERRGWQPSASATPRDSPGSIYITPETHFDAWMAWASARHGKPLPTDKNGGWRVPSLMPPERMQS